jgi:hypothetical protein
VKLPWKRGTSGKSGRADAVYHRVSPQCRARARAPPCPPFFVHGGPPTFWLYIGAQAIFLGFFAGALTMKMAVLLEQTLMAAMIALIGVRASKAA